MRHVLHIAHASVLSLLLVGLDGQPATVSGTPDPAYSVYSTPPANGVAASSTNVELGSWTKVAKNRDLAADFFVDTSTSGGAASESKMIAFLCYPPDASVPKFVTNPFNPPDFRVTSSDKLIEDSYFSLEFAKGSLAMISQADKYWSVNLETRSISVVSDIASATLFQVICHPTKPVLAISAEGLFVRLIKNDTAHFAILGPIIDGHALFHPWNAFTIGIKTAEVAQAKEPIDQMSLLRSITDVAIIQNRMEELGVKRPSSPWISYDLSLAIPLKVNFSTLILPKAAGSELVGIVKHVVTLITTTPLLADYMNIYDTLGSGFPDDFALWQTAAASPHVAAPEWVLFYQQMNESLAVAKAEIMNNTLLETQYYVQSAVLANIVMQDVALNIGNYPTETDLNPEIIRYFTASYSLAWMFMESSGGNITIGQAANITRVPPLESEELLLGPLKDKPEDYWFSAIVTKEVTTLVPKRDYIFPELALLANLNPAWLAEHSTIGDNFAAFVLPKLDEAFQQYDIEAVANVSSLPGLQEMIKFAGLVCTDDVELSFCYLVYINKVMDQVEDYVNQLTTPDVILDLRSTANIDMQRYSQLLLQQQKIATLLESISERKTELKLAMMEWTQQALSEISDATLSSMVKTNKQVLQDAVAAFNQSKEAGQFEARLGKATLEQARSVASDRYKAAMAGKDAYLKALSDIGKQAMTEITTEKYFAVVTTTLGVADTFQSIARPNGQVAGGAGYMNLGNEITALTTAISKEAGNAQLRQMLANSLPKLQILQQNLTTQLPLLDKLREMANPLLDSVLSDKKDPYLFNKTTEFRSIHNVTMRLNLTASIQSLGILFDSLAEGFCNYINRPAYPPCITIINLKARYFDNLQEAMESSDDALQFLGDILSGADGVDIAGDTFLEMESTVNTSNTMRETLTTQWSTDRSERQTQLIQVRRQQWTDYASTTLLTAITQMNYLSTIHLYCVRTGYVNAGMVPETCLKLYSFQKLSPEDMNLALSFESTVTAQTEEFDAFIPTRPQAEGDTAYLELRNLMLGQSTRFRLPYDYAWLKRYNWINNEYDLTSSVIYLEKLTIYLPPTAYSGTEEVVITIRTGGIADVGPASKHRYYRMPSRQLQVAYTTGQCQKRPEPSPYAQCGASFRPLCFEKSGISKTRKDGLRIPLFTDLHFSLNYSNLGTDENGNNPIRVPYLFMASPFMIRVKVTTSVIPVATSALSSTETATTDDTAATTITQTRAPVNNRNTANSKAAVRPAPAASSTTTSPLPVKASTRSLRLPVQPSSPGAAQRCCPVGSYTLGMNRGSPKCLKCPTGSVSQFGGLFCLTKPEKNSVKN
uniref:AlNc14C22G2257 protein n=1 Tax=Albugo laibachii Nc14 TaxID=890382 RepID=F0W5U2_9STRA|nr:AlNc14C22G2257 [Albugo laibachii Nc14]|eukprot:CCA16483.1 AlNc14C22G2257 [Albugo laibachii Nc14]